ncbi:hypothetical protein GWK47_045713 [Chionoecetes opilio]|uniref:Endonuclease/exonuclease/phosphatase domain-containing protein n=1 Tax=Chionoecetes opilio TaxID=41210 RepID=A0A8J5CXH0_CHIOP|nr:hypothetical protein GWK47_045713 [Chionoecetes opilio]
MGAQGILFSTRGWLVMWRRRLTSQYHQLNELHQSLGNMTVLAFPCNQFGKACPGVSTAKAVRQGLDVARTVASINFFNSRSPYTCEDCARTQLSEHGDRQFALVTVRKIKSENVESEEPDNSSEPASAHVSEDHRDATTTQGRNPRHSDHKADAANPASTATNRSDAKSNAMAVERSPPTVVPTTSESTSDAPYKIITLNIAGLTPYRFKGKLKLLSEIVQTEQTIYGGAADMRVQAEAFLRFAQDLCLTQTINIPTRGDNILDVVLTNNDDLFHNFTVDPTNLSDHNIVTLTTTMTDKKHHRDFSPAQHTAVIFNHLNFFSESICWDNLKRNLNQVDWQLEMSNSDPEVQYNKFLSKCHEVCEKHVPIRKTASKKSIPRDRKVLMRKRTKLRKKLRQSDNTTT